MKTQAHTEAGITTGLIDAMLTLAKVLALRLKTETFGEPRPVVMEALRDLHSDPDMIEILTAGPYNPYVMKDGPEMRETIEKSVRALRIEMVRNGPTSSPI